MRLLLVIFQGVHGGYWGDLQVMVKMLRQDGAHSVVGGLQQGAREAMQAAVGSDSGEQFFGVRKQVLIVIVFAEVGVDLTQTEVGVLGVVQGQGAEEVEEADDEGEGEVEQKGEKREEKECEVEGENGDTREDEGAGQND